MGGFKVCEYWVRNHLLSTSCLMCVVSVNIVYVLNIMCEPISSIDTFFFLYRS